MAGRQGEPAERRLPFNPLHFHILRRLAETPRRPSGIADALGVSRTTLSTAVNALEGRGLPVRGPDPDDARAKRLSLTTAGREVVAAIRRQDRRNAEAMLALLDEEERDAFVAAAGRIAAGLAEGGG